MLFCLPVSFSIDSLTSRPYALFVYQLDGSLPLVCSAFASLSLGLCFVGSASADAAEAILTALMDRCTTASEASHRLTGIPSNRGDSCYCLVCMRL